MSDDTRQAVAIAEELRGVMKLVIFPIGGYWQMRCERHAPARVVEWLQFDDPPGFLEIEEVVEPEAKQRCVACLAESFG